jgi:outer membrane protein TolC
MTKRQNLDLRIFRQRLVQAELARAKSWSILKPQLSLQASYTRNDNETAFGDIVLNPQNQLAVQMQLQWAFLNLASIPLIQMAHLSVNQLGHASKQLKREILYGTARAYYGVLLADGLMQISRQTWKNAKEHLRISQARLKAGVTPELAVTRAQLDLAKAWQSWIQAENGLRNARLALALLLNKPSFKMRPVRPAAPTLPSGSLKDWRKQAMSRREEVKSARLAVNIAKKGATQKWMAYLPTLAAVGQIQGSNAGGFNNRNFQWSVTVVARMNLYSGGTRHLELREAYSKVLQAKLEMAKATRKVDNEVTQAYIGLGNAKIALQVAKKQLKLAKRSFELTEARYKTGVATPVEVSDALTALQSARIATLREELNFELAILQLRRAVGLFNP